jgi:hypothetical protein
MEKEKREKRGHPLEEKRGHPLTLTGIWYFYLGDFWAFLDLLNPPAI